MRSGDTYIRAGKRVNTDPHLWVVISEPGQEDGRVVAVNITSQSTDKDQSCVILPGEHPFVSRESVILYAGARVVLESQLREAISANLLKNHSPVNIALLKRIRDGAAITDRLPLDAERLLQKQGIIPANDK